MSEDKVNFQTPTAFPHTISYQLETGKKKKKKKNHVQGSENTPAASLNAEERDQRAEAERGDTRVSVRGASPHRATWRRHPCPWLPCPEPHVLSSLPLSPGSKATEPTGVSVPPPSPAWGPQPALWTSSSGATCRDSSVGEATPGEADGKRSAHLCSPPRLPGCSLVHTAQF